MHMFMLYATGTRVDLCFSNHKARISQESWGKLEFRIQINFLSINLFKNEIGLLVRNWVVPQIIPVRLLVTCQDANILGQLLQEGG